MLEILKIYENVEFGLRKCTPKNLLEHIFSKIRSSPVKMKSPESGKKIRFLHGRGLSGSVWDEKKTTDDDFAWRIGISRSQCLKSSKYMKM